MFSSRKPLAIALTLVIMLAMLVPAAMAAPEWVHGVNITYPTQLTPAYVNPDGAGPRTPYVEVEGDSVFKVNYDLTILGMQVDDIAVRIRVMDANNWQIADEWNFILATDDLQDNAVNKITSDLIVPAPEWNYGWYGLQVCARDLNDPMGWQTSDIICDEETFAVLFDNDDPGAKVIKPAAGPGVTPMVSGKQYLLVGKAWDPWWAEFDQLMRYGGIKETWFQYCALTNWQSTLSFCGPNDETWRTLGAGTPSVGVPDQYELVWDTTQVPDDHGFIRFCAKDLVGRVACGPAPRKSNVTPVFVVNRFTVQLRVGWNLISTPLMLYEDDVDAVLNHVVPHGAVTKVITARNTNAGEPDVYDWTQWIPGDTMKFEHGKGYWVWANQPARLVLIGSFKNIGGPDQTPPEYQVFEGWNLIGYTHWGQPATHWVADKLVADYLGMPLAPSVEALWRYDAWSETYVPMYLMDTMVKGAGYWLATGDGGSINP
jgi:hypothetical protein